MSDLLKVVQDYHRADERHRDVQSKLRSARHDVEMSEEELEPIRKAIKVQMSLAGITTFTYRASLFHIQNDYLSITDAGPDLKDES